MTTNRVLRIRGVAAAIVALFSFIPFSAQAQSAIHATAGRYAQALAASRDAVHAMMKESKVPGVSVAVAIKGEIVWCEAFGFADLDKKKNATTETQFGIGSITKAITAVLFARLMEAGKLDLDAPVENYLPQFPHKQKGITARLLLGHLSGLNDEFNTMHYYETRYLTTNAALQEILQTNKLQYSPRARHEYTTSNYTIVAALIEKASGQDFSTAMQQYVIQPLALKNTSFNDRRLNLEHSTSFYVQNENGLVKAPDYDPSFKWAGAGLLSTAADVATFGTALLQSKFLKPRTRDEIFRALKTASGEDTGYGLGWYIAQDAKGRRMYHHGGGGLGISSYLRLYPQEDCVLAILSNLTNAPVSEEVATKIVEAFLTAKSSTLQNESSGDGFGKYFEEAGVNGAFLLYDLKNDKYLAYNAERLQEGFVPASTFKIFNSLVALQTGVIRDENETLKWDGVRREVESWNQDHNMRTAIKYSAVWFYQELARRIGPERMQHYVELSGYGNKDISGGIDMFWLTGGLRITPYEQIAFLVRLHENKLPFSQRAMDIAKDILVFEKGEDFILRAKTGWAGQVGWFVGYVERKDEVYFFANSIDIVKPGDEKARIAIAKNILRDQSLIKQ